MMNDYKLINSAYLDYSNTNPPPSKKEFFTPPPVNFNYGPHFVYGQFASEFIKGIVNKVSEFFKVKTNLLIYEPKPNLPSPSVKNDVELTQETTVEIPIDISTNPINTEYFFYKIDTSKTQSVTNKITTNQKVVAGFFNYESTYQFLNPTPIPTVYNELTGSRVRTPIIKSTNSKTKEEYITPLFYKLKLTDAAGKEYAAANGVFKKNTAKDKLSLILTCFGTNNDFRRMGIIDINTSIPNTKPITFLATMITGSKKK